jgi:cysteine-rich repeat protein
MDLECDDGNTNSLDGCSSECLIEDHFSCLYGDTSSPSICSYDGSLIFRVHDAHKDLYSSSVSIWYHIEPVLPVFEKFPDFSSYIVYAGANVTIKSAQWDDVSNTLNVSLGYTESLVGKTLTLSYTPPTSPYSHAILASSEIWAPSVSNGLSLSYHSE